MGISPMYQGQTGPPWQPTLTRDGSTVVDLTGVSANSFALNIYNLESETNRAGSGVFTIVNAAGGLINYAWNSADTATVGRYTLQVNYTDVAGNNVITDPTSWEVRAKGTLVSPP